MVLFGFLSHWMMLGTFLINMHDTYTCIYYGLQVHRSIQNIKIYTFSIIFWKIICKILIHVHVYIMFYNSWPVWCTYTCRYKILKLHFWLSFEKIYFDDKTLYLNCTSCDLWYQLSTIYLTCSSESFAQSLLAIIRISLYLVPSIS